MDFYNKIIFNVFILKEFFTKTSLNIQIILLMKMTHFKSTEMKIFKSTVNWGVQVHFLSLKKKTL